LATVIVKRPVRQPAPELPTGEVVLAAPPEIPPPGGKGWTRALMVIPMVCMAGAAMLMMFLFRLDRLGPLIYVVGGLFAVGMVGMVMFMVLNQQNQGPSKQEMATSRRRYLRRLSQQRAQVRDTITAQRRAMHYRHPDPDRLWSTAQSSRLWERRPGDWDFGVVRIGVGSQELATRLVPPETKPVDELEPLCAMALRKFVTSYATVADLPVAVA
jgi:DNA segregation ATPase FtsK/SpoIIIE, S-DNA-T family